MIQVIVRALDILEFIAQHGKEPVQLINIAKKAGLSQPTTANIVKTLVDKNYLEHVGRKEGYRLGSGAYHLTGNLSYNENLISVAKVLMEELTEQLNETSLIAVIQNNKRVVLHLAECDNDLNVRARMVSDVFTTATGRLLLAFYNTKELDHLIKAVGLPSKLVWPGAETREGLQKVLEQLKKAEFVEVKSVNHIVGFAVPVYKKKQVIAGLSVFVPESRCTAAHKEKIVKQIRRTAKKIKEQLEKESD